MNVISIGPTAEPLRSSDIDLCSRAVKGVCAENQISLSSDEGRRIGRIAIDLYRHGVSTSEHLQSLLEAAIGINLLSDQKSEKESVTVPPS